ncbi:GTPase IMAP family member 8-like [Acanthochromis polyacanthus]|uniref:GTPase IMAP family member 8-like n=1 Tax=Acanthochromis polyacanthus TaxID=80966 RepID=UPI002234A626|nr:GTPase IMAP family member 8-like [Acanthochromis polyacanthus]
MILFNSSKTSMSKISHSHATIIKYFPLCFVAASEFRIVLLGKSEDKKTKLGNFIIRDRGFDVQKSNQRCVPICGEWRGKHVTVVKTPDLFSFPEQKVREEVRRCISLIFPGPNVLLLLVKPSEFKEKDKEKLKFILSLFGEDAFKHSMVIITHEEKTGSSVNWLLEKCGQRQFSLNNKDHGLLTEKIENIVQENKDTFLTCTEETRRPKSVLNLVLCGRRGAEKTSAVNAILGQRKFGGPEDSSECVKTQGEVCGRRVSLLELPALYGKPQEAVMEESFRCISLCDPEGIHAFILVLPVGALTDEDKGELETIQNTFSSKVTDFTLILFSVELDPTAPPVVDFIRQNRDIQELCQSCGGRSVVVSMKDKQQIPELLDQVDKMRLSDQKPHSYTTGMFAHGQMEKILQLEAEIKKLKNPHVVSCKYFIVFIFCSS